MTDHNREELIEAARAAFTEAWEAEDARMKRLGIINDPDHPRSRAGIVAALTVFEQAHTVQGAEGPEWEYGNEQLMHSHVEVFPASSEAVAKAQAWLYPVRRRRKAGPWLPLEQGDAS